MRKLSYILLGALLGAALMFGFQAGAADLLTGSKVAGTKLVTLNGVNIGQAPIINDSSYLPVRALADSLGLGIDVSGGKINLSEPITQQPDSPGSESQTPSGSGTPTEGTISAEGIQNHLKYVDLDIIFMQDSINMAKQKGYDTTELDGQLLELQQQKSDLEAQLQSLQSQ